MTQHSLLKQPTFLYGSTVLFWGLSWYAITFQIKVLPPEVSVAYRFGLAALLILIYCRWRKLSLRFSLADHGRFILLGFLTFNFNYWLFYRATAHVTSGLLAVVFSTFVFMNIFNARLFYKKPLEKRVLMGACIGIAGIVMIFWPSLRDLDLSSLTLQGIALGFLATLSASLGNMVFLNINRRKLPIIPVNGIAMAYGSLVMFGWIAIRGIPLAWDPSWSFNLSLLYLCVFATVLAFSFYLSLVSRIGVDRAAYATVLFPVVSLTVSTFLENYQWTGLAAIGVALTLIGNLVVVSNHLQPLLHRLQRGRTSTRTP